MIIRSAAAGSLPPNRIEETHHDTVTQDKFAKYQLENIIIWAEVEVGTENL